MEDIQAIGKARRDKAVSVAMKRKEEYLGARVPKALRDRVLERAKKLGIPVSILIRNTLEKTFKEGVAASPANSNDKKKISDNFSSVIGWELIQLNKTVECSGCGLELRKGAKANIGLGSQQPVVICCACKENI